MNTNYFILVCPILLINESTVTMAQVSHLKSQHRLDFGHGEEARTPKGVAFYLGLIKF